MNGQRNVVLKITSSTRGPWLSTIGPTVFLVARIGSKTLEIAQIVSSELDSTSFIIDWAIFGVYLFKFLANWLQCCMICARWHAHEAHGLFYRYFSTIHWNLAPLGPFNDGIRVGWSLGVVDKLTIHVWRISIPQTIPCQTVEPPPPTLLCKHELIPSRWCHADSK